MSMVQAPRFQVAKGSSKSRFHGDQGQMVSSWPATPAAMVFAEPRYQLDPGPLVSLMTDPWRPFGLIRTWDLGTREPSCHFDVSTIKPGSQDRVIT
jgi:hypothetical protein